MKLFAIRLAMIAFVFAIACKKESSIDPVDEPIKEEEDIGIENFAASSYSDNYTWIASWTTRSSWNLPTCMIPQIKSVVTTIIICIEPTLRMGIPMKGMVISRTAGQKIW